jgi:probable phosphoglycerate mutase
MARCFADAYQNIRFEALYCSPLVRARQTMAPLSLLTSQEVQVREQLREIGFGAWDGKTVEQVEAEFHDDYLRWSADPAWNPPTGGDTAIEIARRSRVVVEEIREVFPAGNVLVVSHKATIRIMLCDLLGIDLSRFRDRLDAPVASLAVIEFGSRGPLLLKLADRAHLPQQLSSLPGT